MIHKDADHIIRESRFLVKRLRQNFPDPQDFDQVVKRVIDHVLKEYNYDPRAAEVTLEAIFGGE
jgi:hypothetical protein